MIDKISGTPNTSLYRTAVAASTVQKDFRSALTSAANQADKSEDSLQISGMSDQQKLAELKRLHEETDYSGMSEVEKYRVIHDRFNACFPIMAILGGLFGTAIYNSADGENHYQNPLHDQVIKELERQSADVGLMPRNPPLIRQAYYSGMSDDEIVKAVNQKYSGGTMVDRAGALWELNCVGLGNGRAGTVIRAMHESLVQRVGGTKDIAGLELSPFQQSRIYSLAASTKVSWGQVAQMMKEFASDGDGALEWLMEKLFDRKENSYV